MFVLVQTIAKKNTIEWGGLNNGNFFLPVLEARKSKINVLAYHVSGEGPLPGL